MEYGLSRLSPRTRKIKKNLKDPKQVRINQPGRFLPLLSDLSQRTTPISKSVTSRKNRDRNRKISAVSSKDRKRKNHTTKQKSMSCNYKMNYERPAKNARVRKSSAEVRPFKNRSFDAAKPQSADEATQAQFSSWRFSSESLTTNSQSPGLISGSNSQKQPRRNALSNSSVKSTSLEDKCTEQISNENTVDSQESSSPANTNFGDWVYHGLQDLIDILQAGIKRYPTGIEQQSRVSTGYGDEGFQSSDLIKQNILVETLQGIVSKYRALISNIESQLPLIASRFRESEEVSTMGSEDVNSTAEQKDALIKSLLRKQMQDVELLNKAMNSLISKSGREFNEEVDLLNVVALVGTQTNCSCWKNGIWEKIKELEKEIRIRDSDLMQLQTDYSHVNKVLIDMMKYKLNLSPDKNLMKSSIERICDKAEKLNKRLKTKLLRNLSHYVDCVDHQESSDGESLIFLIREKIKESKTQEFLSLQDEGLLKMELAKLNKISQRINGVNTTDKLLLLNTIDCVAETCDIIAKCISALVKRTINYQKKIQRIQDNQNTSNQEQDSNTGGYTTISSSVTLQPKASISISGPVFYQANLPIPLSFNANNKSPLRGDSDKFEQFLMSGSARESNEQIVQSRSSALEGLSCLPPNTNKIIDDQMHLEISKFEEMRICFLPSSEHISIPSEAFDHSVESRRAKRFSVHSDEVVEVIPKKISLSSNSSDAQTRSHSSSLVKEPKPITEGAGDSWPCKEPPNTVHNSIEDYATAKLSDILGNSSQKRNMDMIVGHPLESYLQNTLSSPNANKCIEDESNNSSSNVLLNLNSREPRDSQDFRAKFRCYINKNPDNNQTILSGGSGGNCNVEVDRGVRLLPLTGDESIISESQDSLGERGTMRMECLDIEKILGNTGFSPSKPKVQRKFNSKKKFVRQKISSLQPAFIDDDEDLRLVKAVAGAKALMIKKKVVVDNFPPVRFTMYSDLIYQELRDFNSVIPEEDSDIQIVIAAARGRVFAFSKQKRILVSSLRRDRPKRFSISCTYTKKIRNQVKFTDDMQLSKLSKRRLKARSTMRFRATKGMF